MLMRSQRRLRACIVGGLDFDQLALLPGANDSITSQREDDTIANRERDDRVKSALAELPETYRAVLALHYAQDLGLREIADRLDLTEGAVRSRLHRARARLRSLLDGTALSPAARDGSRPAAAA
jgi:RNA polymerase sigma-70 factor (ECF subfamily)